MAAEQISPNSDDLDLNPSPGTESEPTEKLQKKQIDRGDFIILFSKIIQEEEFMIVRLKLIMEEINELIQSDYIVTYLTDGQGNLGFKYIKRKPPGFDTSSAEDNKETIKTVKDDEENSMYPIDRGNFKTILTQLREDARVAIQELDSMYSIIESFIEARYIVRYFIDQHGNIEYTASPRKRMGFPGVV